MLAWLQRAVNAGQSAEHDRGGVTLRGQPDQECAGG